MDLERRRRLNRNFKPDIIRNPSTGISFGISVVSVIILVASLAFSGRQNGEIGKWLILVDMAVFIISLVNFIYASVYFRREGTDMLSKALLLVSAIISVVIWAGVYGLGIFL